MDQEEIFIFILQMEDFFKIKFSKKKDNIKQTLI